jgi:RNA polymerase sigma-70 factor (ECF subfamily)
MTLGEHSFELLFKSHFKGLCQFAVTYVKDSEVARELVQDAFVSLWLKRDTIDLDKQVRTYLSTTVRNKCLNYLRDNKRFSKELLEIENLTEFFSFDQPDHLVQSDLLNQIDHAISELPEKCREIFKLNRNENLKYQQIADQLGISVKTVETQMSKALAHLRIRLSEYLPLLLLLLTSLFTIHYSLFTFHFSLFTFHSSQSGYPLFLV